MRFGVSRTRARRRLLALAVLAYAVLVVVNPLFHHDLDCHWRTPGHCVACTATPPALDSTHATPDAPPALRDLGDVERWASSVPDAPLPADTHGRSPPL